LFSWLGEKGGKVVYGASQLHPTNGTFGTHFQEPGVDRTLPPLCAASPDGQLVACTGNAHHEIVLWSVAGGAVVHRLGGAGRTAGAMGWNADARALGWSTFAADDGRPDAKKALDWSFRLPDLGV